MCLDEDDDSSAMLSCFGSRNMVNSQSEEQQMMDRTACFRRESTKKNLVSQGEPEIIVSDSLDTDISSMLVGDGLSCKLSRSGAGSSSKAKKQQSNAIDQFFN